jgi:ribose-phosphate pyrophosphokinase
VSLPDVEIVNDRVPVFVDDIVSTGQTLLAGVEHLVGLETRAPICIAVHGVFADGAAEALRDAGAAAVVTCNTISHPSNGIDMSQLVAAAVSELLPSPASGGVGA